jgi:hypothetical protein
MNVHGFKSNPVEILKVAGGHQGLSKSPSGGPIGGGLTKIHPNADGRSTIVTSLDDAIKIRFHGARRRIIPNANDQLQFTMVITVVG